MNLPIRQPWNKSVCGPSCNLGEVDAEPSGFDLIACTAGAIWFVINGVDWTRVILSDLPFLKFFFDFNKGGLQLLAGTLLIMGSGVCVMAQRLKPALGLFALGVSLAASSSLTPFRPCDELNPTVSCKDILDRHGK